MTLRTISTTVIFHHPFRLDGLDEMQPPGAYDVETEEELMPDVSFLAYRRILTQIQLHARPDQPGSMRLLTIDPNALDEALAADELADDATASTIEPA